MKQFIKRLPRFNPVWFPICAALIGLYLYLCFAYNLQFYTEDGRYIQTDMTNLASLYQWGMTSYRVSSSLGCFIYYPLIYIMKIVSNILGSLSGGDLKLLIIPMMMSKLVHSMMVVAGWIWFAFEAGKLLYKRWEITPFFALLCFVFTAMLPVNIFLVKTNNYDSIYNILCLIGSIYFYRYIVFKNIKELASVFFLFAFAMQEKFAAYPIFMACFMAIPFFLNSYSDKSETKLILPVKEIIIITVSITAGSLMPSLLRFIAELLWAPESLVISKHFSQYQPFLTFPKALGTASHFTGIKSSLSSFIVQYAFVLHIIGFIVWTSLVVFIKQKIDSLKLKEKKMLWIILAVIFQILFLLWAFASVWYDVPESGKYPFDTPPSGTYLPPHLSDSHPTFYYGANHFEYIFIQLMQTIGFFKPMLYSPVLILLITAPFVLIFGMKRKEEKSQSIAMLSVIIFDLTMVLVVIVNLTGVPFGGRYTNIYLTLLGISSFLSLLAMLSLFSSLVKVDVKKILPAVTLTLCIIFMAELLPYGPSFQVFGNWIYPAKGCGGWGEPTSALVQAAREDPFLKQALGKTYTTYTGLAIEKPFFTPLINLRLIRSRSEGNIGKRRTIQYMLAEATAIGQNPWLKNVRDVAKTVDGAVVWEWACHGSTSAWLIDLYKLGLYDYAQKINPDKVERHYRGEWFF